MNALPTLETSYDSVLDQDKRLHQILGRITLETVDALTQTVGYQALKLERLLNSQGTINVIYFVAVKSLATQEESELVLRITNPWIKWAGRLQANEAYILKMLERWNKQYEGQKELQIPVPKVLSFSSDAATSPLQCEYSLVEKMKGCNAEDVIVKLRAEQKAVIWKDWLRIARTLKSIPASFVFTGADHDRFSNYIGSFYALPQNMAPVLRDGPPVGPAQSPAALQMESLRMAINDVIQCPKLKDSIPAQEYDELLSKSKAFLLKLESGEIKQQKIWPASTNPFAMCHDDLHLGNLLVDPDTGHITAVLDWDRAHWGLHDDYINDWGHSLIRRLFRDEKAAQQAKVELNKHYPASTSMKIRHFWRDLPDKITWTSNVVATWLGRPPLDEHGQVVERAASLFGDVHGSAWRECAKTFATLDRELKLGNSAFTSEPSDEDSEDDEEEENNEEDLN